MFQGILNSLVPMALRIVLMTLEDKQGSTEGREALKAFVSFQRAMMAAGLLGKALMDEAKAQDAELDARAREREREGRAGG
jgi:hypothetical protein